MAQKIPKFLWDLFGIPTPSGTTPQVLCRRPDGTFSWQTVSQLLADIEGTSPVAGQSLWIDTTYPSGDTAYLSGQAITFNALGQISTEGLAPGRGDITTGLASILQLGAIVTTGDGIVSVTGQAITAALTNAAASAVGTGQANLVGQALAAAAGDVSISAGQSRTLTGQSIATGYTAPYATPIDGTRTLTGQSFSTAYQAPTASGETGGASFSEPFTAVTYTTWSSGVTFSLNDIVTSNNKNFISMQNNNLNHLCSDAGNTWWSGYIANWTPVSGSKGITIDNVNNACIGTCSTGVQESYHSTTLNVNHYVAAYGMTKPNNNITGGPAIVARMSTTEDTGYVLFFDNYDDGDTVFYPRATVYRMVSGTGTSLGEFDYTGYSAVKMEVSGTGSTVTITVKGSATINGTYTTIGSPISDTNSARITSGTHAAVRLTDVTYYIDTVAGGDL